MGERGEPAENECVEGHAQLVVRCAWCERVRAADATWVDAVGELVARATATGTLTHGICPTCFAHRAPSGVEYPT
jgi:hypothetical protein